MTVLSETIRLRVSGREAETAAAWARSRGESVSGMVRRLLSQEVPGLADAPKSDDPSPAATVLADLLAGDDGAGGRLIDLAANGSEAERGELLALLVTYLVFEYRAPPDAQGLRDLVGEAHSMRAWAHAERPASTSPGRR